MVLDNHDILNAPCYMWDYRCLDNSLSSVNDVVFFLFS